MYVISAVSRLHRHLNMMQGYGLLNHQIQKFSVSAKKMLANPSHSHYKPNPNSGITNTDNKYVFIHRLVRKLCPLIFCFTLL
jgi:hypothetical protein